MESKPSAPDALLAARVAAVTTLAHPARRALYEVVSRSSAPVGRDEAAEAAGLARSTAAFHLERLAAEGLLLVEYRRLNGRTGPGSGRPAKLYRRSDAEVAVSLPERHYDLAGDLMASAIERSVETGIPVRDALRIVAEAAGRTRGASVGSLTQALEDNGFEPHADGDDLVLGNCPFHRLAQNHTDIVCELNYELIQGIADGAQDAAHTVLSDPGAGRCCIRISPAAQGASRRHHTEHSQKTYS